MQVYFTITIDTECDKDRRWRIRRPLGFDGVHRGIGERLQPLFERYDAVPTYLLSPEVIRDEGCAALLGAFGGRAELGTHLHGEMIEPEATSDAVETATMQSSYPAELERAKLANLTRLFDRTFGYAPRSFRAGRFGIGRRSLPILQELGYTVDSSVAPFGYWSDPGGTADHRAAPDLPWYHPSSADPHVPGDLRIMEIPVTIHAPLLARLPAGMRGRLMESPLLGRRARRVLGEGTVPRWLRPWKSDGEEMIAVAEGAIARHAAHDPMVLVMMFHNVEAAAGLSPYPQTEEEVELYLGQLETFLRHATTRGWKGVGLAAAAERVLAAASPGFARRMGSA